MIDSPLSDISPRFTSVARLEQTFVKLPFGPSGCAKELVLPTIGLGRCAGRLERHTGHLGQDPQCLRKLDAFVSHDETKDVATDIADPTLPRLTRGIDLQAGARVVVPGASCHEQSPLCPERKISPHELANVDRLAHALLSIVVGVGTPAQMKSR